MNRQSFIHRFRNNRLSLKLGVSVAVVGLIGLLAILLLGTFIVSRQFGALEQREIATGLSRTEAVLHNIEQSMIGSVRDWGFWDDSAVYLRDQNRQFENNYLTAMSMKNLDANAITYMRFDRRFVRGNYFDLTALKEDPAQARAWMTYATSAVVMQRIAKNGQFSTFARIGDRLLAIGATAIFNTDGSGTPEGFVIIGREITPDLISDLLQVNASYSFNIGKDNLYNIKKDDNFSNIKVPVHGVDGRNVAYLIYRQNRDIAAAGHSLQRSMAYGVALLIVAMIAILYSLVRWGATNRLSRLEHHLDIVSKSGALTPIEFDGIDDEIGHLQISFNQMIHALETLHTVKAAKAKALDELAMSREAEQAKSRFIAMISHELRTPLTGVIGMIQLLKTIKSEDQRSDFLHRLEGSANLLRRLINDVLDFSKLDSEVPIFDASPLDLHLLAQSVLELYDAAASRKAVRLDWQVQGERPVVLADQLRLQQILGNLVNNAIKFTSEGEIQIRIKSLHQTAEGYRWRFEVRDNGIGVPPEMRERLFHPFVQGDPSTTRKYGGTGLGLSICKHLVEAMSGEIDVISDGKQGATFWFEVDLPEGRMPASHAVLQPASTSDAAMTMPRLNILLAEDSPIVQMVTSETLKAFGHDVTVVENGRLAVEAAANGGFDVIIMDMQMPEMGGAEASRKIRALDDPYRTVPIMALTADADVSRRHIYADCGFNGFMTKPFDSGPLLELLHELTRDRPSAAMPMH